MKMVVFLMSATAHSDQACCSVFKPRWYACMCVCMCVRGQGTAEKLVQHLVLHSPAADPTYVDDFLLTYRTFLKSPCDVTTQLMTWLDDPAYTDKVLRVILKFITSVAAWHG